MFRKRMSEALKEAREYRDPTCPICEGEGCQCPGEETIEEGFASDAQRRAAFAQGYKAKGKKKKKEEVEENKSSELINLYQIKNKTPDIKARIAQLEKELKVIKREELEEKFTSQQIKQAYGILNDPRYKQGNYSGAVAAINKLAPGLADHPDVKNALKRANEELEEASKYLRYSDLLIQKGRMQRAGDKQGERLTDIEIEKEKKKLGIKDEFIPEGMVKRVMQTVHDKLSKEGGAAGFDDLAKEVKKEFGINISKDTLKKMPGVKQHRDGDFILEGINPYVSIQRDGQTNKMIYVVLDKDEKEVYKSSDKRLATDYLRKNFSKLREETELNEFTQAQLARLKKEYDPLKGQRLSMDQINKMQNMLNKYSTDMLVKLANTDIPFLATSAKSIAVMKRGKKWSDFKQGLDMSEADELQCEACWSGYKQVGLKKKGNRMVPNCVPEEVYVELFGEADLSKSQVKMVHKVAKKLPKGDFKDRYGKDGEAVRYGTATNMVKKKLGISEFTKRDFKNLEKVNDHDGAAKGVVDMHGTSAEKMKIDAIIARNNMRGHITKADQTKRDDIVRKYYNKLKEMKHTNTGRNDIRGSFTNAQLSRMKQTWARKSISDLTKSVKDYVMKLDKPTQAAIIAAKINHLSDYVDKNFDESKVIGEGKMAEMSYKDKFAKALKDSGKSLADMSDDEKKKFFNKVDSMHSAKNEEVELDEMKHEMAHEMMKKEMMKKMEMMKAETDPAKLDMMKKEMMKEMEKMPEMMKKEMMKKMNAAYKMNMSAHEEAEPMTRDTMSLKDKEINAMKMNAMKMPIRAMSHEMKKKDEMSHAKKKDEMKKMNAMKKMEELTPAQKKLPAGLQKAIMKKDDKSEMKKMNAMKKMKEGKYHATKPGSLEEAVMSALSHPHIKG